VGSNYYPSYSLTAARNNIYAHVPAIAYPLLTQYCVVPWVRVDLVFAPKIEYLTMSAQIPAEDEKTQPADGLSAERLFGEDQFPRTTHFEVGDDNNHSQIVQMGQGNEKKNVSPRRDPQNAEPNTTDENHPVEPIRSTALAILSLSFTAANFIIALDGSILGLWATWTYLNFWCRILKISCSHRHPPNH
jgi:hypothetical protein